MGFALDEGAGKDGAQADGRESGNDGRTSDFDSAPTVTQENGKG